MNPQMNIIVQTVALENLLKVFHSRERLQLILEELVIGQTKNTDTNQAIIFASAEGNCILCNKEMKTINVIQLANEEIIIACMCEEHKKEYKNESREKMRLLMQKINEIKDYLLQVENSEKLEYVLPQIEVKAKSLSEIMQNPETQEYQEMMFALVVNYIMEKNQVSQSEAIKRANGGESSDIQLYEGNREICLICNESARSIIVSENYLFNELSTSKYISYKLCEKHCDEMYNQNKEIAEKIKKRIVDYTALKKNHSAKNLKA